MSSAYSSPINSPYPSRSMLLRTALFTTFWVGIHAISHHTSSVSYKAMPTEKTILLFLTALGIGLVLCRLCMPANYVPKSQLWAIPKFHWILCPLIVFILFSFLWTNSDFLLPWWLEEETFSFALFILLTYILFFSFLGEALLEKHSPIEWEISPPLKKEPDHSTWLAAQDVRTQGLIMTGGLMLALWSLGILSWIFGWKPGAEQSLVTMGIGIVGGLLYCWWTCPPKPSKQYWELNIKLSVFIMTGIAGSFARAFQTHDFIPWILQGKLTYIPSAFLLTYSLFCMLGVGVWGLRKQQSPP